MLGEPFERMGALNSSSSLETSLRITEVRVLVSGLGYDTVRCVVTGAEREDGSARPEDLELRALDREGAVLQLDDVTAMGSTRFESPEYPGISLWRVALSARVSSNVTELTIEALLDEATASRHIPSDELAEMRDVWLSHVRAAEFDNTYDEWFKRNRITMRDLAAQRVAQHHLPLRPLFSVIVPLYHTPLDFFRDMTSSVLLQSYEHFELVLVNSTPEDAELARAVDELAARDERVRVITLDRNYGITENTNAGIDAARGDFLAFFDHDDILEPDCLYWYAKGISDHPTTDLLYCDEDKLVDGHLEFPFFKPDWDPFFLETNNFVCHMLTVRADLVRSLPRPTSDLDGAQDHSMAFAAGERARNVYHVRRVLYHWRVHEHSTAGSENVKPESKAAGRLAVKRHLERLGCSDEVLQLEQPPHCFRVVPSVNSSTDVSVIVYGSSPTTCLEERGRLLLESSGWEDGEVLALPSENEADLPSALAAALGRVSGEFVVLASERVRPRGADWLAELVGLARREGVGVVSPIVVYPDDTVCDAGVVCPFNVFLPHKHRDMPFETMGVRNLFRLTHQVSAVRGTCIVMRASVARELVRALDDCPGRYWDVGLCLEARSALGLATLVCPASVVEAQLPEAALGADEEGVYRALVRGKSWLLRRWPETFCSVDPFYNIQLRQDGYYGLPLGN